MRNSYFIAIIFLLNIFQSRLHAFTPPYSIGLGDNSTSFTSHLTGTHKNPASIPGQRHAYDVLFEASVGSENIVSAALVDTYSSPVSAGLGYVHYIDEKDSHEVPIAMAYIIEKIELAVGLRVNTLIGNKFTIGYAKKAFVTLSPGVLWKIKDFSLGIYSENSVYFGNKNIPPKINYGLAYDFGFGNVALENGFQLTRGSFQEKKYNLGAALHITALEELEFSLGYQWARTYAPVKQNNSKLGLGIATFIKKTSFVLSGEYQLEDRKYQIGITAGFAPMQRQP